MQSNAPASKQGSDPAPATPSAVRPIYNVTEVEKKELAAIAYAEDVRGTLEEHKAIVSSVLNRYLSGEKQFAEPGQEVTISNVIAAKDQYQAFNKEAYLNALNGKPDYRAGYASAQRAVEYILKKGVTTNATFIHYLNPSGNNWFASAVAARGLIPATPPKAGDWYLYVQKK